jgi:hypothetical protein
MLLKASTLPFFYSALFVALWAVASCEADAVPVAGIASFSFHVKESSLI